MVKQRSRIWEFFSPVGDNNKSVSCNACHRIMSISGSSTGNLKRHIRSQHPNLVNKMDGPRVARLSEEEFLNDEVSSLEHQTGDDFNDDTLLPSAEESHGTEEVDFNETSLTTDEAQVASSSNNAGPATISISIVEHDEGRSAAGLAPRIANSPKKRTVNAQNNATSEQPQQVYYSKAFISRPAPVFEGTAVVNGEFTQISLSDYRGKYVVFFFYQLDFTSSVCPTEILAFSDRIAEFENINTEVVACSVDSHFTHLAWINTPRTEGGLGRLNISLLSDLTRKISKDYGVYMEDLGHALRGLFIIDQRGVLRQITMNDLRVGRSVDETLRLVQAFQYTDSNDGEVCAADWRPGGETVRTCSLVAMMGV